MTRLAAFIAAAAALAACQSDPGPRYLSGEDQISFLKPDGWTQHRDFPPFAKKSFREWWQERQKLRNRAEQ